MPSPGGLQQKMKKPGNIRCLATAGSQQSPEQHLSHSAGHGEGKAGKLVFQGLVSMGYVTPRVSLNQGKECHWALLPSIPLALDLGRRTGAVQ